MQDMEAAAEAHFQTATATVFKADLPLSAVTHVGSYLLVRDEGAQVSSVSASSSEDAAAITHTDGNESEDDFYDSLYGSNDYGTYGYEWADDAENILYLVYKVEVNKNGWDKPITYYYYTAFHDLTFDETGTCVTDLEDYNAPDGFSVLGFDQGDVVSFRRGFRTFRFVGYETIEDLHETVIADRLDSYTETSDL